MVGSVRHLKGNKVAGTQITQCYKKFISVVWEKPMKQWVKLNFDGSAGKTGVGSIGGVIRNHKGNFLLGYAEQIDPATSTQAEVAALLRGLELVRENGWRKVWLEGDAKAVLDIIITHRKFKCTKTQGLIQNINTILLSLDSPIATHVYRKGNKAADKLASMGHFVDKAQVWRNPPSVLPILLQDAGTRKIITSSHR